VVDRRIGAAFIDIAVLAGLFAILSLTVGPGWAGGARGGFGFYLSPAWSLGYLALVLLYYFTTEAATGQTVCKPLLACASSAAWCGRYNARIGLSGAFRQAWVAEGFLDAVGTRGADALVDRERLPQVCGSLAGVALPEVNVADSLQGTCLFWGRFDVAGDGQRPGVLVAGLAGGRGAEREFAEAVQRLGPAEQVAEVTEQCQGPLVTGGGGRIVPGPLLHEAQGVEGMGLGKPGTEGAGQPQGLLLAGRGGRERGGRVVPGLFLDDAQGVESVGLTVQVAEVAEQRQGLLLAGGGGGIIPGQLLYQAQAVEGPCLDVPGTGAAGSRQGLLVAGSGGRVVPGQSPQEAQLAEGVGLAGQVTNVTVQRQRLGQAGGGGRIVSGLPLQCTQRVERVGLAELIAGLARGGERGLVEGGGLVPVTAGGQEAAHRIRYRDGIAGASACGGVVRGGVQVGALGLQPDDRPPEGGQFRRLRRRGAGQRAVVGAGPGGEVPTGGQGGVQVVVQHPPGRSIA